MKEVTKDEKLFSAIVQKAWEDAQFKEELAANPVATIEKFTGEKLNLQGKRIVVRDQSDASVTYINIPAQPDFDEIELTEEQLEAVAGGAGIIDQLIDKLGDLLKVPTLPTIY